MDYKDEILAQAKTFIDDIESKDDTLQLSAAHYVPQTEPQCNFVQQNTAYRQNRPYRQKFQPNRSFTPRAPLQQFRPRMQASSYQQPPRQPPQQPPATQFGPSTSILPSLSTQWLA